MSVESLQEYMKSVRDACTTREIYRNKFVWKKDAGEQLLPNASRLAGDWEWNLRSKNIQPFLGYPERPMNLSANCSFILNPDTTRSLTDKLIDIEQRTGMKFYVMGRDFIPHITVSLGIINGDVNQENRDMILNPFLDKIISKSEKLLINQKLDLNFMAISSSPLVTSQFKHPEVARIRTKIAETSKEHGLKVYEPDLLHINPLKVVSVPDDSGSRLMYLNMMHDLKLQIWINPLVVEIKDVFYGMTSELVPVAQRLNWTLPAPEPIKF